MFSGPKGSLNFGVSLVLDPNVNLPSDLKFDYLKCPVVLVR